jgi:iron(III) transport system substrate-binding protein
MAITPFYAYLCIKSEEMRINLIAAAALIFAIGCGEQAPKTSDNVIIEEEVQEVMVYSHRHYDIDQVLFDEFEAQTGIHVNVLNSSADELTVRMLNEGENSPADLFFTSDAANIVNAQSLGLLQSVNSAVLNNAVPLNMRAVDGSWYGLTMRARVLAYNPDKVSPEELTTYEDLANENWAGRILVRSSSSTYNQSLLASIIANDGDSAALAWASAVRANMAREPKGNDRDQVKAIAAGEGDIAIVNTYYIGKLVNSENELEKEAGEAVKLFFPNQDGRGAHINISGGGVTKYAPNKENAIKLLEFLTSVEVQQRFADGNYEYPVNPNAQSSELLQSWGTFKMDLLPLQVLGDLNKRAVEIFNEASWN